MSQQPKTETDRLANVIQVLQLGQKTGTLVVERNDGPNVEQGFVTLANGQILQANVGQHQGQDALVWLGSWGHCRFAFSAEQLPSHGGHSGNTGRMPAPPSRGESGSGTPFNSPLPTTDPGRAYSQFTRTTGNLGGSGPLASTVWGITPLRTRHIEEGMHLIEQMGLSRAHRRLFLLIDGRRTLQELVRLLTIEPAEVYRLLKELEHAGVVQA